MRRTIVPPIALAVAGLALAPSIGRSQQAGAARVTIRADMPTTAEAPVLVELKSPLPAGAYALKPEAADGRAIPAQVFADGGKTYLAAVVKGVRGESKYALQSMTAADGQGVAIRPSGDNLRVTIDGQTLTEYIPADGPKPYFYPLLGPGGEMITRSHPMKSVEGEAKDHNHQRSFWFTHGDVDGVDFWASDPLNKPKANDGRIKETSRAAISGPVVGVLRTTDDWLGPDGKKLCEDERVARFYKTAGARILDFDVTIKATNGPVTFKDTKEGMFGLRVASSMDVKRKEGGKITNAEGVTDTAAWGKASPWVDYTGPVGGRTVGVAILNHPSSFRHPTTWHVRDYGLFAANPFGYHDFGMPTRGDHTIPAGQSITFRHRVVLHEGDTASAGVADAFASYARPPEVAVTE